ncbi:MAG: serine/threonine protein kinase [Sandaracinaceae bacterium]|nr:serine/threonine protein kinase [Sandaracinaceae bacterium]
MSSMNVAEIGDIIGGRYQLTSLLGEGGMGAVYAAKQVNLDRDVAVKLMHAQYGMQPDAAARFEREAKVSAALHHPNAVKIFDFGTDEGRLFLVMEKLVGKSLSAIVGPSVPPPPHARTVDIVRQTAEVLIAAHGMGLVHRDLKPDNIFLEVATDGSDRVVVVDFGLAFIAEREGTERMTQEGMIMGTPMYMSPEQCRADAIGPPTDIYAVGCMLYEMVTQHPPFEGPTMAMLAMHLFQPVVPPSQKVGDKYIPRALESLILSMLEKRPEDRPTADSVAQALRQLQLTLGERERARGVEHLEGRASRMINTVRGSKVPDEPTPPSAEASTVQLSAPALQQKETGTIIAVVGPPLPPGAELALRANGYSPIPAGLGAIPPNAAAVFAPGADIDSLHQLVSSGALVVTDTDASDQDRLTALLALGVSEVVTRPLKVDQLAKKLQRVLRKAKRKGNR